MKKWPWEFPALAYDIKVETRNSGERRYFARASRDGMSYEYIGRAAGCLSFKLALADIRAHYSREVKDIKYIPIDPTRKSLPEETDDE